MDPYINGSTVVLRDNCNRFIYEVSVFVKYKDIYSMVNCKLFSSNKEILNVIPVYKLTSYIEVTCELYSAPYYWLSENNYIPYIKPKKRTYVKKIKIT